MSNLLIDELNYMQKQYYNILEQALKNINDKDHSAAVIDEIEMFWYRNKNFVECVLRRSSVPYTAYVFTGAPILGIKDCEHYPFVTLGNIHFWDDPICTYAKLIGKIDNSTYNNKMKDQVRKSICDSISILEQTPEMIYILPVRMLAAEASELAHKAALQSFQSLFKEQYGTKQDYYKKFKTFRDIENGLRPEMTKMLILSEDDDKDLPLDKRFKNYVTELPISTSATDAEVFFYRIYSFFAQAFNIVLTCIDYQLIPFIRSKVTLQYILTISCNFMDEKHTKEVEDMFFKCVIAHCLYQTFDKAVVKKVNFRDYYNAIREYDFEKKLFRDLKQQKLTLTNLSLPKTVSLIEDNFTAFYQSIKLHNKVKCLATLASYLQLKKVKRD